MGTNNDSHKNKKPLKKAFLGSPLDTLAQLGTKPQKDSCKCCPSGTPEEDFKLNKGTFEADKQSLQNRAKRKFLGSALALGLVDVIEEKRKHVVDAVQYNEEQALIRSYWNMYYCARKLSSTGGKVEGRYCKNRLCMVCNSIRTAVLSNSYQPVIDTWEDAYFVTVTVPNIDAELLKGRILEMQSIVNQIQGTIKKRLQRAEAEPMKGIRKFECTYNPITKQFHPHYHIVIEGKKNAEDFYNLWLEKSKHLGTSDKGQDITPVASGTSKELFKYFTKVVSGGKDKEKRLIYLEAIDIIFRSIKGIRTVQSFGFTLPKNQPDKNQDVIEEAEPVEKKEEVFIWNQPNADWFSVDTGGCLSEYKLSQSLKDISSRMVRIKKRNTT